MGRKQTKIITGLDIGTTKVCAIMGHLTPKGELNIVGFGSHPSPGLRQGTIVDLETTTDAIQKAVQKAESMASAKVREVFVGIAGNHVMSQNSAATLSIDNPTRGVTEVHREEVLRKARECNLPPNHEVSDCIIQEFVCDGQPGIVNPVGMSCKILEVRVHLVIANTVAVANIMRAIKHAGLRVRGMQLESLASSLAILSDEERDLGVALIDIGGGTSDIGIFSGGCVRYTGVIPLGGDNISADVALVLRVSRYEAENIKKKFARSLPDTVSPAEEIEVTDILTNQARTETIHHLSEVVEARLEQIFLKFKSVIDSDPHGRRVCGVVLTGGTSLMSGIDDLASRIFEKAVKVGKPEGIMGLSGLVSSPIYSTAVGLVLFGLSNPFEDGLAPRAGIKDRVLHYWRRFLEWYASET